jgi:predicted hydrolase (HD superfamily)
VLDKIESIIKNRDQLWHDIQDLRKEFDESDKKWNTVLLNSIDYDLSKKEVDKFIANNWMNK